MKQEEFLKKCQLGDALEAGDLEKLKEFAGNGAFQRMLTTILQDSDAKAALLLNADLGTAQGIRNASVLQGEARGLVAAVLMMVELVAEQDDETQEKE